MIDAGLGCATDSDVPLYGGLDTVGLGHGRLQAAESAAAAAWGAAACRFIVNGSTSANQSAILAMTRTHLERQGQGDSLGERHHHVENDNSGRQGRGANGNRHEDTGGAVQGGPAAGAPDGSQLTVIVQRTAHRSVLSGLVLAGVDPIWILPRVCELTGVPLGTVQVHVPRASSGHLDPSHCYPHIGVAAHPCSPKFAGRSCRPCVSQFLLCIEVGACCIAPGSSSSTSA
jgi:arginine decarboxylase